MSAMRLRAEGASPEQIERGRQLLPGDRVRFSDEKQARFKVKAASDRVRFSDEKQARFKVKAASDRFVILTKPFNARRTVIYTVIDLVRGVRGPDDSWACGYETDAEIADSMERLHNGAADVSPRRSVTLDIADVKAATR